MNTQSVDEYKRIQDERELMMKQYALYDDFASFERAMMRLYKRNQCHELINAIKVLNDAINNNMISISELSVSENNCQEAAKESIRRYEEYKKRNQERQSLNEQLAEQCKSKETIEKRDQLIKSLIDNM